MNADRHPQSPGRPAREEALSSVVDGESHPDAVEAVCRDWRSDSELRSTWHTYHLIGDVLRSDDLASSVARDPAFLQGLRARLATEPVPLAPSPLAAHRKPLRWMAPAAVAAGFMAVGVAVVVLRPDLTGPSTGSVDRMVLAQPSGATAMHRVGSSALPASAQALVIDGQVIRDARLDAYFEAHRGAVGALPSAVPGGALRSVEILVPQR